VFLGTDIGDYDGMVRGCPGDAKARHPLTIGNTAFYRRLGGLTSLPHQRLSDREAKLASLRRALAAQKRVTGALFMREIQIRWGRRNLGFAWLFAEPLVFAFPVMLMWSMIRTPVEHGLPMMAFVWTGYLPILMFRHTVGRALYVVKFNGAMLFHRSVTPLDLVISRCGLELIGAVAATVFSFTILYMFGVLPWPHDLPLLLVGNLYMAWWCFALALIIAPLSERSEIVEHIWLPCSYMYLPISGFMYMAVWLPIPLRNAALTALPCLHSYEMIRAGLFGDQIQTFYDIGYTTAYLAVLTLIGLWLMRNIRRHLELEF
jgi:capsular polysaccharide transport system permease protein